MRSSENLCGMMAEEMVGKSCKVVFRALFAIRIAACSWASIGRDLCPTPRFACAPRRAASGWPSCTPTTLPMGHGWSRVWRPPLPISPKRRTRKSARSWRNRAVRDVLNFMRRVAVSEAVTIMLAGENGTGKDPIAKTLHYESMRRAEPFISINYAAIPDTLLESELFAYEKGAFTDARSQKRGILELADKGTLFLDEIGEMPLPLQAKLLRVLEEQSFRRLGGLKDINLDLRVIAATNKNLREAVKEGAFRQDLYFRLNVIQISIPALR
jgi:hypothetical protein